MNFTAWEIIASIAAFHGLAVSVVGTGRTDESDKLPAERAGPGLELLLYCGVARMLAKKNATAMVY